MGFGLRDNIGYRVIFVSHHLTGQWISRILFQEYIFQCSKYKHSKWLGYQVTCIITIITASYLRFIDMLTITLPFCPPMPFVFSPTLSPLPFLSNAHPTPSPTGGSESGRSTPSLSTYSDGKSPSSTSTYMAAPRHFHIPGRPYPHRLARNLTFSPTSLHLL